MTTATADTEKTWTLAEVERQEQTLEELRQRLAQLQDRRDELDAEIARATADGEDTGDLQAERREVARELEEFETIPDLVAEQVRLRRKAALREKARERLQEIKKKVGGLTGEAPRRAKKARELAEKLERELTWLACLVTRRTLYQKEARALAEAFDLEAPDLKSFDVDTSGAVADAKGLIRKVSRPRDSLTIGETGHVVSVLKRLFDEETPTPELLEELEACERDGAVSGRG